MVVWMLWLGWGGHVAAFRCERDEGWLVGGGDVGCVWLGDEVWCGGLGHDPAEDTLDLDGPGVEVRLVGGGEGWTGRMRAPLTSPWRTVRPRRGP